MYYVTLEIAAGIIVISALIVFDPLPTYFAMHIQ